MNAAVSRIATKSLAARPLCGALPAPRGRALLEAHDPDLPVIPPSALDWAVRGTPQYPQTRLGVWLPATFR